MNDAGRDLMDWCETNGMQYVNSYVKHQRRGTWYHQIRGEWYELDGFIMSKKDRHRMVRRMKTTNEDDLSDHRTKILRIAAPKKRWRTEGGHIKRTPWTKWEALKNEDKKREYKDKTREKMEEKDLEEWT